MTRRKWYVVTVGRDVGVFQTWLEVGPLVRGLPNALHQSFPTEEEARRIFARERARGNTKIVDSNSQPVHSTPPNSFHRNESFSRSTNMHRSYTESSIIINPQSSPHTPRTSVQAHSSKTLTQSTLSSPSHPLSPIPPSTSEPSSSTRRFEIIDALFNKGSPVIGVEARASNSSAQSSTQIRHTTSLGSPRLNSPSSPHLRAVVKTPSWLESYPKAVEAPSQPLSPLSIVDLPLHHFKFEESYEEKSSTNRHITSASYSQSSVHNCYGHDVDPRSPLLDKAGGKIPELSSVNALPFARPSPSAAVAERLPMESYSKPMKSSLLLKPSFPLEL